MAKKLITIEDLHDYFTGVVSRAKHHAQDVQEIIYPLLGLIVANGTEIEVWEQDGGTGNLLWAKINGTRYAFRYEHSPISIEIRKNTYKGDIIKKITNKNTLGELRCIFSVL